VIDDGNGIAHMAVTSKAARSRGHGPSLSLFSELSCILTGEPTVASSSAQRHLKTLQSVLGADMMNKILERFRKLKPGHGDIVQAVKEKLVDDSSLGPPVKKIIILWFTGRIMTDAGTPAPATQDDYFEALMWSAAGSHPPALSDGYFGHWRYPPNVGP
jgi:hypothetical protein